MERHYDICLSSETNGENTMLLIAQYLIRVSPRPYRGSFVVLLRCCVEDSPSHARPFTVALDLLEAVCTH